MSAQPYPLDDVKRTLRECGPIFHALGDEARQDIVLLLAQHERLNVSQITGLMHLSRPAISHHLKVLKQAGVIEMVRESRENYYSLLWDEPFGKLRQLVEQAAAVCS